MPAMLAFRLRTGEERAYPYSYLSEVRFEPSRALMILFPQVTVTVNGHRLDDLYKAVVNHKASRIQQADTDMPKDDSQPFVQDITFKEPE